MPRPPGKTYLGFGSLAQSTIPVKPHGLNCSPRSSIGVPWLCRLFEVLVFSKPFVMTRPAEIEPTASDCGRSEK